MFNFLKYNPPKHKEDFDLVFNEKPTCINNAVYSSEVSENIEENLEIIKGRLHSDKNGDVVIREFYFRIQNKKIKGIVVSVDGLSSTSSINEFIIKPLIDNDIVIENEKTSVLDIKTYVENILPQMQVSYNNDASAVIDSVNFGNAALFVDGCRNAAVVDVKSWEHRGIGTPLNEDVVQGPHEAFNEMLRCNTALIRKTLNISDLIVENLTLGKISRTPASLAYIHGTVNEALLKEIKKKIFSISQEYVLSVFDIEKILEERNILFIPQIITTERPDKVSRALVEGRVALLLNGSSHVLILPSNITDIASSPEDAYLRKPYSIFIKIIRIIAIVLSLLTPGLYLAVTQYHGEVILTDMYITINNASSKIPFLPFTEIIIMELSFELIKEAAIRIPGAIGSSLGIVGGLILGQTAVNAGLVSPIVIIIVSICGISSFAIPSYSLSFAFRIMRFVYIFAAHLCGLVGVLALLVIQAGFVLGTKSFGVPICVPFSPSTSKHPFINAVFDTHSDVHPPDYLKSGKLKNNRER